MEWCQRNGNIVRDSLRLSPWNFNKLISYDSTNDSLLNIQASLRGPHTETTHWTHTLKQLKLHKWEQLREARKGESSDGPILSPTVQTSWWAWQGKAKNPAIVGTCFSQEKQSLGRHCCRGWGESCGWTSQEAWARAQSMGSAITVCCWAVSILKNVATEH